MKVPMLLNTTIRNGKRFVLVPEREYRRLTRTASAPELPLADANGNANAIDFARASIARTLASSRKAAGLSQGALAKLAGLRTETISRIESGKHTPTVDTLERIDKALRRRVRAHP